MYVYLIPNFGSMIPLGSLAMYVFGRSLRPILTLDIKFALRRLLFVRAHHVHVCPLRLE